MKQYPNVILRALKFKDRQTLHHWINDPDLIQYTNTYRPISEMEQKEWFNDVEYFRSNNIFGIAHHEDEELIGICGFYGIEQVSRKAELRIKIFSANSRGHGFGESVLMKLLEHGFKDINLNRIWLKVLSENKPAINLYKKCGFSNEGRLRQDMFIKGRFQDVIIMGLLKEAYNN